MPIVIEHGRWRSVRTADERRESAQERVNALNPREKLMLQKVLAEWQATGRSKIVQEVSEIEWEEQPVPVREWLLREDLIGETGKDMYPQLREDLVELFEGDYHEAILTGAIGWGKDFFATTACMRMLYELCCLKNPQHTLGLAAGEPIHIVPISRTVAAARRVVFGGVCKKLALAHWFRGKYEETMEEVRFKKKGIYIVGGASQDAAALGLNVIFAIVDESNFLGEGKVTTGSASAKAEDKATMIYNALARRVKARYKRHGVKGMIMLVSSKRSTQDFTERRIKNAIEKKEDRGVFVRDYAIWNVHPEPFKDQKWYRVAVSAKEGRCKLLEDDAEEAPKGAIVFKIPQDYLDEFRNDPDGATRDIAGIATDFVGRLFITKRVAIDGIFNKQRPSTFKTEEWTAGHILSLNWGAVMSSNAAGEPTPICCRGAVRHIHIDMSTSQCATGFCMAHLAGSVPVWRRNPETGEKIQEEAPVIHVDGVLRVNAPDGGDIDHGEVRGLVYRLQQEGFPIRSVSMDQFCGPPNLQMFKRHGFKVEEVGERRFHVAPHLTMRQAVYEGRIVSPFHSGLDKELKELEWDEKAQKVRHPQKGSKDLADALTGVVYYITQNMRGGLPLAPTYGASAPAAALTGPVWTSGGNVVWPTDDGDGFIPAPFADPFGSQPQSPYTPKNGDDGSYPACIIK